MSWNDKRHITRIFNAFKRNKDKIYKEDIDALKSLNEIIEDSSKTMTAGNLIYAKLLCLYLRQNAYEHKGVKNAVKYLQRELQSPLDHNLGLLTKELNNIELTLYLETKGVNCEKWYTKKHLKQEDEQDVINKIKNEWTFKLVEKAFYSTANDLLKDLNNYE